jgi:hypothetical protein
LGWHDRSDWHAYFEEAAPALLYLTLRLNTNASVSVRDEENCLTREKSSG